jgi:hypothetical protein
MEVKSSASTKVSRSQNSEPATDFVVKGGKGSIKRARHSSGHRRPIPAEVHLIRRVHAIVDVPVKDEEEDEELGVESAGLFASPSALDGPVASSPADLVSPKSSPYEPPTRVSHSSYHRRTEPHTITKSGRAVRQAAWDPRRVEGDDADQTSDAEDAPEDYSQEPDQSLRKRTKRIRHTPRPAANSGDEGTDDDELMIGAEVR